MERYAIYIPAEGKCRLVPCDDGDTCKLKTLQELVGGPIEATESSLEPTWAREPVDCIHLIVTKKGCCSTCRTTRGQRICMPTATGR